MKEAATTQDDHKHDQEGGRGGGGARGHGLARWENCWKKTHNTILVWSHVKQVQRQPKRDNQSLMIWNGRERQTHSVKKKKERLTAPAPFDRTGEIKKTELGCWLVELAGRSKLPAGRPVATHRPEEPFLNYKLGAHLSGTQRNRRAEECTHTHKKKKHGLLSQSGIHTLNDAVIRSAPPTVSLFPKWVAQKPTTTIKKNNALHQSKWPKKTHTAKKK